ncbi:MAG: 50S ribosomal protein L31 [Microgenomates group bacterium GW2011_GWC1_41_8]|uniref:Large ribosomal subunit protein bL31 n=3 Tax=Candidatus Roizmaniibacteriota TaxID=1752723 RepID=A0A0G0X4I9_9BACT|nr:MAG: 50S ribosomal protein L31 [Candidatus Roizmanbacteria bacterium GW2011_GWA1_41_13]KKS19287.1 MAG: 50S ribosomal protein L31 [Candidatus Roizmanbacteria bacterium GW2011_GWC2_41_7]KKS23547.1 MAG: 50S ribosomal protein L31 [Microgenomates group bacterium GW2011_GWC1_41_8]OGK50268.1 MAG: 50S ribosomal protein L31 [Candidatus Roizmanbacteria bacterium RIFCSPLOWO2_01_FULL_40_14]
MKQSIHPTYFDDAKVTCACGASFTTGSTMQEIRLEVCDKCHPLYTGKMKFLDTKGRVEKFQEKQKRAVKVQIVLAQKKQQKIEQRKREENAPKTLREMLLGK